MIFIPIWTEPELQQRPGLLLAKEFEVRSHSDTQQKAHDIMTVAHWTFIRHRRNSQAVAADRIQI